MDLNESSSLSKKPMVFRIASKGISVKTEKEQESLYRLLPPVSKLRDDCQKTESLQHFPTSFLLKTIQETLETLRQEIQQQQWNAKKLSDIEWISFIAQKCQEEITPKTIRVLNGTGVILHTGLGRAPLSEASLQAIQEQVRGYTLVEVERNSGERNEREVHLRKLLQKITHAESAVIVNNNAAATVLVLNEMAQGKEVIISRGQLVEIGGSFRIPEIMECSHAILREVGATNKTHLNDYEKAIGPNTAMIMKVHPSNFRIVGFTESVPLEELVALGQKYQLPVVDDLGSGALIDLEKLNLEAEPTVQDSLKSGADLTLFSGDKLMGGCQAGIIVGKERFVQRLRKNPLYRAFRVDKLTLAVLEATLLHFLDESWALEKVPTLRMIRLPKEELTQRAQILKTKLESFSLPFRIQLRDDFSAIGSGSLPTVHLPTTVLTFQHSHWDAKQFAQKLRLNTPCVFTRIQENQVCLDLRTIFPDEETLLETAFRQINL